jgi:hypothetical protein
MSRYLWATSLVLVLVAGTGCRGFFASGNCSSGACGPMGGGGLRVNGAMACRGCGAACGNECCGAEACVARCGTGCSIGGRRVEDGILGDLFRPGRPFAGPICGAPCGPGAEQDAAMNAAGQGMAGPPSAAVGYPYYTLRGPRDFLSARPADIGP